MTFNMPSRMVRIASPDAPILPELHFPCVSHSGRHRYHRQLFGFWVEPHHRVAARAAYPNLTRSPINVDRIRNVVSLTGKRIDFPLVRLWIVAAEVAAAVARYPYDSIVRDFEPARTVHRRFPFGDLASRRIDHSYSLAVQLRVPDLPIRRDVDAVRRDPACFANRRHIRSLLGFEQLILFDLERRGIEPEDSVHRGIGVPADAVLIEAQCMRVAASLPAFAARSAEILSSSDRSGPSCRRAPT